MLLIGLIAVAPSPFKKIEAKTVSLKVPASAAQKTIAAATTPPAQPAQPKPFDPNDTSTWPVCSDNQQVWADDGQCHEKPAQAASVAQPSAPVAYNGDHNAIMDAAGIAQGDRAAVDYIVSHESGWCPFKHEGQWGGCPDQPSYAEGHAYGLCQALPGTKMSSAGADWLSNPITQMRWCDSYAQARYGGWWNAYSHWIANGNW